jgi:hypothetical protein
VPRPVSSYPDFCAAEKITQRVLNKPHSFVSSALGRNEDVADTPKKTGAPKSACFDDAKINKD